MRIILLRGKLQLQTAFSCTKGVCLRGLSLCGKFIRNFIVIVVARSPRNQRKAAAEGKQKSPRQRRGKDMENSDENKEKSSTVCDEKGSVDKTLDITENKSAETKSEADKGTSKADIEETERNQEEKSEVRQSGRLTRNKEKHVIKETEAKEVKGKGSEVGLNTGDVKMKGKNESDICKKESSKKNDNKDISKRSSSLHKADNSELSVKDEKGGDSEERAPRRRKTDKKHESSEDDDDDDYAKRVSSRKEGRKTKELIKETAGEGTKKSTKPATFTKTTEGKQKTEKAAIKTTDSLKDEGGEKASKGNEKGKKTVKIENTGQTGTDMNSADDSDKERKTREKDTKPSEEDEGQSDVESVGHDEEFNDDSDYDPEYDPDRLWCVCRKPHGNRLYTRFNCLFSVISVLSMLCQIDNWKLYFHSFSVHSTPEKFENEAFSLGKKA